MDGRKKEARENKKRNREDKAHDRSAENRVPMTAGANLGMPIPADPNFHYRWIEGNKKGRVERALKAWYDFCYYADGSKVQRPSGAFQMYLMKIELKYWEEDQKAKQDQVTNTFAETAKVEKNEYLPEGHTQAIQKNGFIDPMAS